MAVIEAVRVGAVPRKQPRVDVTHNTRSKDELQLSSLNGSEKTLSRIGRTAFTATLRSAVFDRFLTTPYETDRRLAADLALAMPLNFGLEQEKEA